MGRKGISSLVQVMILIAMTVSLITILFSWGENLLKRTEKSSESEFVGLNQLTNVQLTLSEAKLITSPLAGSDITLDVKIRNDGDHTIESFVIYMITTSGEKIVIHNAFPANLAPLEEKVFSIKFQDNLNKEYFEIFPRIKEKVVNYKIKFIPTA